MEEFALQKETDDASKERLEALRQDLADQEETLRGLEARWERRGTLRARASCAAARRAAERGREAAARGQPGGERDPVRPDPSWSGRCRGREGRGGRPRPAGRRGGRRRADRRRRRGVDGIPTGRLLQGETAELLEMEAVIGERLIGQRAAVPP